LAFAVDEVVSLSAYVASGSGFARSLAPLRRRHLACPSRTALTPQLGGGPVLAGVALVFLFGLAGRDLGDPDGVPDHVGRALLALSPLGIGAGLHERSDQTQQLSMLRSMPVASEEVSNPDLGHLAARRLVGLVPNEHAP
jgi:hypothetical protein